jgi:hypothetical protein
MDAESLPLARSRPGMHSSLCESRHVASDAGMCVEAVEKGMSLSVISNKIGADWCIILRSLALEGMAPQAVTDKTSVQ